MAYDRKIDFKLSFLFCLSWVFWNMLTCSRWSFFHIGKDFIDLGEIPHELNVKNKSVIYIRQVRKSSFILKVRKRSYLYSMRFRTFSTFPKFSPWKSCRPMPCNVKTIEGICWLRPYEFLFIDHMPRIIPAGTKKWWEVLVSMLGEEILLKICHPLKRSILRPKKNKTSRVGSFPFATIFVGLWLLVFTPQKDDSIQFHGTCRNVSNWR